MLQKVRSEDSSCFSSVTINCLSWLLAEGQVNRYYELSEPILQRTK
jgi:hypothetical protein